MNNKKPTPIEVQEHSLLNACNLLDQDGRDKVERYTDTFQRMLNKGKHEAQLAFTIVGVEMTKKAMKQGQ